MQDTARIISFGAGEPNREVLPAHFNMGRLRLREGQSCVRCLSAFLEHGESGRQSQKGPGFPESPPPVSGRDWPWGGRVLARDGGQQGGQGAGRPSFASSDLRACAGDRPLPINARFTYTSCYNYSAVINKGNNTSGANCGSKQMCEMQRRAEALICTEHLRRGNEPREQGPCRPPGEAAREGLRGR